MKQRIFTGFFIALILISAFLLREFTLYAFDTFALILSVFSAYEFSKLLSKLNFYNNKWVICAYPVLSYGLFLCSLLTNMKFYLAFVLQVALILILMLGLIVYSLIFKRKTDNEIKTRDLKHGLLKFSIYKSIHTMFGLFYPTVLLMPLYILNHLGQVGLFTNETHISNIGLAGLLFAFAIPVITDIFCMLCGTFFKGKKLCPNISPNKTVSGAIGGVVFALLVSICLFLILDATATFENLFSIINLKLWHIIILSVIASVSGQFGDIFESFIKRKANVKDSGSLLPGHGGILDRIDSHLFVYPVVLLFFVILLI